MSKSKYLLGSLLVFFGFISHSTCGLDYDPCFEITNGEFGKTGNCIPTTACYTNITVANACPSFPADHVCCFTNTFPGREARGAWVATVTNIDWPNSPSDSVEIQQKSLEDLIDSLDAAGINIIYFQVRPSGDALYQSTIEPWSKYLTGKQGQAPNPLWDPLQYVIEYAHARNIEVHAWINPYRAGMSPSTSDLSPNHMAIQFPEYAYPFSSYLWMDPGAAVVQNRTYDVVIDLVSRYDLDGIHMDDYFYPYPVTGLTFPDEKTYAAYTASGGKLSLDDWRRDNVNKLIQRLNEGVHKVKAWIKFSISPFGIYKPCQEDGMPCSINGFDQFSGIYCDAKLWLNEGWIDVLQPQLYWKIDPPAQSYPVLLKWWVEQNTKERHIYAGNYLSRVLEGWPLSELTNQIQISRLPNFRSMGSWGNIQFSAKIFGSSIQDSVAFFKNTVYQFKALQPPFPWLAEAANATKPRLPTFNVSRSGLVLFQSNGEEEHYGDLHKVIVYLNELGSWRIHRIIKMKMANTFTMEFKLASGKYAIMVEDRYGQESEKHFFHVL